MKLKAGDIVKILNTKGTSDMCPNGIPDMNAMIGKEYEIEEVRHNENEIIEGEFPYMINNWGWLEENVELVQSKTN